MPRRKKRGSATKEPSHQNSNGTAQRHSATENAPEKAAEKSLPAPRPPKKSLPWLWACIAMFGLWLAALVLLAVWR